MSRILQIRRGTTQQNDNFTGMPGEITFDTDTQTLRVHDGETLGGFKIARTDQINNATDNNDLFDINDVSDEFWTDLFSRVMPKTINHITGEMIPFASVSHIEYVFDVAGPALFAQPILVCVADAAGYTADDEVLSFGIGDHTVPSPNLYSNTSGVHARLFIGGAQFWVPNKDTGVKTNITPDNWRIKFRLYY